jgi:hypothetical protein
MMTGVPEAKAELVNPEALPVGELAVLLVLAELAALLVLAELAAVLDLLLEPQPVSRATAITAAARLAVDARARRGAFKRDGLMIASGLADMSGPARATAGESTRVTAPTCHQRVNAGWGRRRRRRLGAPIEIPK